MLPIPMMNTFDWSGTYSQPNFLWYDYSAATASTDTANRNTISAGAFTRMWDFSGNSRHSDFNSTMYYRRNGQNGLSIGFGTASQDSVNGYTSTFSNTKMTIISVGKTSNLSQRYIQSLVYNSSFSLQAQSTSTVLQAYNSYNSIPSISITYSTPTFYVMYAVQVESASASIYSYDQSNSGPINSFTSSTYECSVRLNKPESEIYEFMVWDGHLTTQQINNVFGYLKSKWDV
jgi:hypothetical protein